MSRTLTLLSSVLAAAALGAACGGGPSDASGVVVLRGTVVDTSGGTRVTASAARAASGAARVTVTVREDPRLTTTVNGSGTFELNGVPEGGFTLVFTSNGVTLGTIDITGAEAGQEIRITVQVTTTTVILIHIENSGSGDADDDDEGDDEGDEDDDEPSGTCTISGGKVGRNIELEGNVQSGGASGFDLRVNGNRVKNGGQVTVTTAGATFKCNGKTGGNDCRAAVAEGAKVHVSGMLQACDADSASVSASEVKVQK